jgi:hypothetical protein
MKGGNDNNNNEEESRKEWLGEMKRLLFHPLF